MNVIRRKYFYLRTVLLLPMLWVASCSTKEDTVLIQEMIQKAARSAEAHAIGDLMDVTVPNFTAQPGGHDARSVRGILFAALRQYGRFSLHYPAPEIRLADPPTEAEVTVYFLIVRRDQAVPGLKELYSDPRRWLEKASEKADLYQMRLSLTKIDNHWKARQAHLEGFKGYHF